MKTFLRNLLAAAMLLPAIASCDDSDQNRHNPVVYNIVEYAGFDGGSIFHYYPAQGNTPVVLWDKNAAVKNLEPGDCVFLGYRNEENSKDTPSGATQVKIESMAHIYNGDAVIADSEKLQGWDAEPMRQMIAMWRAGEKIVLRCLLTASSQPRYFGLYFDAATLGDPVPTAYIYHRRDTDTPNYSSQFFSAFSLAPILHPAEGPEPAYTAIRIRFSNAANPSLNEMVITL